MAKKKDKKKKKNLDSPSHAIALFDFNPYDDADADDNKQIPPEHQGIAPDKAEQMGLSHGEKVEVISKTLDWWIICKSVKTGNEGYVPAVILAPICEPLGNGYANEGYEGEERDVSTELKFIPCVDQYSKYFPNAPQSQKKKPCPKSKANIFSLITFWWINELMVTGFKRPLVEEDIWELQSHNLTNTVVSNCEREWTKETDKWKQSPLIERSVKKDKEESKSEATSTNAQNDSDDSDTSHKECHQKHLEHEYRPSMTKMFIRAIGPYYIFGNLFKILHDIVVFISPYILSKLITFVKTKNEDIKWGYTYAVLLLVSVTFQSICLHQYFQRTFVASMRLRSAIMGLVYRKMLTLSSKGRQQFTAGEMVNMMSVDSQKCHDFLMFAVWFWSAPFQIIAAIVFLYNIMGWSVFPGFLVLVLLLPLTIYLGKKEKLFHGKQMGHKDTRSKIINEIINGIKILKLYAWEDSFVEKIMGYRKKELSQLRKSKFLHAKTYVTNNFAPVLVSLVTFATYVYAAGEELTAEKAFVAISLFNIVRFPLVFLPRLVQFYVQYKVSVDRITKFLTADELNEDDVLKLESCKDNNVAIEIEKGSFQWNDNELVLKDVNLSLPEGSLTAIVGQVGTGKSSLLSAILGEIHKVSGNVTTCGKMAYVSQQAWIQNKTLRDNILFTKKFKKEKYHNIVNACALKADLDILPVGDMTEIGERGINLSGGQKQRVSLARAVYNNGDVYLLDDPLSAVDAHVGKHIFDSVIGPNGLLRNKTRILVTHNLSFLPQVDRIVVLKNNTVSEIGTYAELLENGDDFAEFLRTYHIQSDNKEDLTTNDSLETNENPDEEGVGSQVAKVSNKDDHDDEIQELLRQITESQKEKPKNSGAIYQEERAETGTVKRKVFLHYFQAMGVLITTWIFFFGLAQEVVFIAARFWLAEWSSQVNVTDAARDEYVAVYGGLGLAQALCLLAMSYGIAIGSINASNYLHDWLLSTILRCPMSFFETTPIGRIVNRFVKDINIIDEAIPKSFESFIATFTGMLATIFVISYSTPIFLAVLVPIALLYFFTQRFYVATSRQLKRIESVNRSPIYNHYLESIGGVSTIRAYRKCDLFIEENENRIDKNQAAYFPSISSNRWLAMRLEFCGNLVTFFAALFSIVNYENMTPGIAGLSISYALQITQSLNWLVRMTSELETNIISVERIKNYIDMPKEAPAEIPDNRPTENWPEHGAVTFDSYSVRYRAELDLVLQNIDCSINAREKIGIVGRTGAGKSSMVLALFRIIESASGKILIDGVDIAGIGLKDLRKKLSIIPQDPVLFTSSLRFNLDPFNEFDDEQIWRSLEVSHLKTFVMSLPGGLQYEVLEGGENLSVGQRQLICLARALLRSSKILVLDEATAAVDMETDAYIQEAIRNEFTGCTVFTIAHRLNTIVDYDRIMVLDKGHIVEFDTPDALLCNKISIFYGMAKDAGLTNENEA